MTFEALTALAANIPALPMMSFSSYWFVFAFLPVGYLLFLVAHGAGGWPMALRAIALISLVYYAQFGWKLVAVLICSVLVNYAIGIL
ncbi:MAG: hypothetical protein AAFZ05_13690, partial [Pseudomonadota bacterium]